MLLLPSLLHVGGCVFFFFSTQANQCHCPSALSVARSAPLLTLPQDTTPARSRSFFHPPLLLCLLTQNQHNHVQANGGRCQRCHPLLVIGGGARVAHVQLRFLRRQPGRLGGQEAGVGAVGEARLRGEQTSREVFSKKHPHPTQTS